jgi:mannose-6-phosphate isomerase-like protein (cupin superfamily)
MDLPVKVNVAEKLEKITRPWSHGIVGQVNETHVKVVKLEGEFVWHSHEKEDELFYVVAGELMMHFRAGIVTVKPGEFIVVPHGLEHKPEAPVQTSILLVEPAETVNTGNAPTEERTHAPEWI